jgi:hypothetical protein
MNKKCELNPKTMTEIDIVLNRVHCKQIDHAGQHESAAVCAVETVGTADAATITATLGRPTNSTKSRNIINAMQAPTGTYMATDVQYTARRCVYDSRKVWRRGGYGGGTMWRFHTVQTTGNAARQRLQRQLNVLGVKKVMNPPGDGLCFFHCIVEAITPNIKTKYERVKRAIVTQRKVIQHIQGQLNRNARKAIQKYRQILGITDDMSDAQVHASIQKQLQEITTHPSQYTKEVIEIIQAETADALGITIEIHRVTEIAQGEMRVSCETFNQGRPQTARLIWDHQGSHYILSKQRQGERGKGGTNPARDNRACGKGPTCMASDSRSASQHWPSRAHCGVFRRLSLRGHDARWREKCQQHWQVLAKSHEPGQLGEWAS